MTNHNHADSMEWMFKAGVALLALLAFCIQPFLPLVDPGAFLLGGIMLGGGLSTLLLEYARPSSRFWVWGAFTSLVLGATIMIFVIERADDLNAANAARCKAIEGDMLSASPKIANGPDVYQALGCRLQTTDNVKMPQGTAASVLPDH